jgi:hypothetical protein
MAIPRADLSPTSVARTDAVGRLAPVADPRQEAFQRSLAGQVGKSMPGEVLAQETDGSFLVKVAGTLARMQLPQGAQVGQQLPLTLVALSPRPTFEVSTRQGEQVTVTLSEAEPALPGAAADGEPAPVTVQKPLSYAAGLLAKAPLIPSDRLPSIDPNSTPATLSETGRSIATVLNGAAARAPTALVTTAPLTPGPGQPPQQIAAALQQSLSESGLFYESHVAEWSSGERPLEALAREPQMQRAGQAPAKDGMIDQDSARFINFQLNPQEQGRVAWEGQPWPGQAMRWEVSRDAPERQPRGGQDLEPPWRSGMRLKFPLLGDIEAKVVLQNGQLHIQVEAGSGDTSQLLRSHAERLTAAMEAAGLPLSSLNIRTGAGDE